MTVQIRLAAIADAPTIVEFNQLLARESEGKDLDAQILMEGVKSVLADSYKGLYFLAEEGNTVLGQMLITTEWSDWRNGWMWWIQSVYVRAKARRRGVFRELFRHVESVARQNDSVCGLRLYVEKENLKAHETYLKMGMRWTTYQVMEKCPLHDD